MQWIKAHLAVVIAGSVSLVAVGLIVFGMFFVDVASAMQEDQSVFSQLSSAAGANKRVIDDTRKAMLDERRELHQRLQQVAEGIPERSPIMTEIFPQLDSRNQDAPFEFKRRFKQKQQELLAMLNAKDRPSEEMIEDTADSIDRIKQQQEFDQGGGDATRLNPRRLGPAPVFGGLRGRQQGNDLKELAALTPEERVQEDPHARASVQHARTFYCYANLQSLDPRPEITDPQVQRPKLEDMWYAQASLWLQEDVIGGLAELNESVAKTLPDQKRWVGYLPVKHLKSLRVGGYVPPALGASNADAGGSFAAPAPRGGPAPSGGDGLAAPMSASAVMTKRGSTDAMDVLQFTMELVVEANSLPAVIDHVSSRGFYTLLQISYRLEQPNLELVDYIYGPQPTIWVSMLWEAAFPRSKYEKWMPPSVDAAIDSGEAARGGGTGPSVPGGRQERTRPTRQGGDMPIRS